MSVGWLVDCKATHCKAANNTTIKHTGCIPYRMQHSVNNTLLLGTAAGNNRHETQAAQLQSLQHKLEKPKVLHPEHSQQAVALARTSAKLASPVAMSYCVIWSLTADAMPSPQGVQALPATPGFHSARYSPSAQGVVLPLTVL